MAGLASFDAKWEDSFLYEYFEENKFFIVPFESPVPYSQHVAGNDRLVGGFLWNMPEKDIEQYVRPVWERLHELMLSGDRCITGEEPIYSPERASTESAI